MKQIIINKTKELLRFMVYILLPLAGGGWVGVSCVDTVILPDNKTVDEDFWQKKSEVEAVVATAYTQLRDASAIRNMIVWGDINTARQCCLQDSFAADIFLQH